MSDSTSLDKDLERFDLTEEGISRHWEKYKKDFNKKYDDEEEEKKRKENFVNTIRFIEEHNEKYSKGLVSSTCGLNNRSDYFEEEHRRYC